MLLADDVVDGTAVLHLDALPLADGLADLRWRLHDLLRAGARTVVVDLGGVPRLPNAALATLLWAHRICRARGGAVVLRGANAATTATLHRTGLERVLQTA
jgi:anti-sigma B factor antagonist